MNCLLLIPAVRFAESPAVVRAVRRLPGDRGAGGRQGGCAARICEGHVGVREEVHPRPKTRVFESLVLLARVTHALWSAPEAERRVVNRAGVRLLEQRGLLGSTPRETQKAG